MARLEGCSKKKSRRIWQDGDYEDVASSIIEWYGQKESMRMWPDIKTIVDGCGQTDTRRLWPEAGQNGIARKRLWGRGRTDTKRVWPDRDQKVCPEGD